MAFSKINIRTAVQDNIGRTDKDSVIDNSITLALEAIGRRHRFRVMRTESDLSIVADDLLIALPSGTVDVHEARIIDGTSSYPILLKTKKWITDRWPNIDGDSKGKPVRAYVEGSNLYLQPQCDDSYTVRLTVTKYPTLASDSDTLSIPGVDECVINWCTAYVLRSYEKFQEAVQWERRFETALKFAMKDDRARDAVDFRAEDSNSVANRVGYGNVQSSEPWLDPFYGTNNW